MLRFFCFFQFHFSQTTVLRSKISSFKRASSTVVINGCLPIFYKKSFRPNTIELVCSFAPQKCADNFFCPSRLCISFCWFQHSLNRKKQKNYVTASKDEEIVENRGSSPAFEIMVVLTGPLLYTKFTGERKDGLL